MSQLGSIFEPDTGDGPRGRDLRAEVSVPAWVCGHPYGHEVEVPRDLPAAGGYVRRADGHERGDTVHLRLPHDFPVDGTLRLRGLGEAGDGGRNGDLLLTVHVEPGERSAPPKPVTWSPGQVVATTPAAPRALVVVVVLVFTAGAVAIALL